MPSSLMVNFFILLVLANFSQSAAPPQKQIPEAFDDVTCVVHLSERDGHRIILEIDNENELQGSAWAAIGAKHTPNGWFFSKLEKDNIPAKVDKDNHPDLHFVMDNGALSQDGATQYWLLSEDFFRFQRMPAMGFAGCKREGQENLREPFHLTDNGKKSYLMGVSHGKTKEKLIGTFIADNNADFTAEVPGKFYGLEGGNPVIINLPNPVSFGFADVFCKQRHPVDVFPKSS